MAIYRVKTTWTGFTGAPGYTFLHFDAPTEPTTAGAKAVYDAAASFFSGISSQVTTAIKFDVSTEVEILEQTTGQMIDVLAVTGTSTITGIMGGGFSSSTGACVTWETGEIKNGRRVRGRTFLVPLASANYDTDGTLTAAGLTDLRNAATALAGGGFSFGIFSRPSAPGASDGSFHTVTSGRINDKTAILTNRRD